MYSPPSKASVISLMRRTLKETLELYESGRHNDLPITLDRLSHVLLWETTSVSLRVRRATARFRVASFVDALQDLNDVIRLSERYSQDNEADVDALRIRAAVYEQIQWAFQHSVIDNMTEPKTVTTTQLFGTSVPSCQNHPTISCASR